MLAMASLAGLIPLGVLFLAALIVIPWDKSIITEPFVWDAAPTPSTADVSTAEFSRRTVHFSSQGLKLEGWLYSPKVSYGHCFQEEVKQNLKLILQALMHDRRSQGNISAPFTEVTMKAVLSKLKASSACPSECDAVAAIIVLLPIAPCTQGLKQRPPVVVAAHGIAGQKDMGLEPFAELFASKGLAVLLFDYRNFGGSEGEPRNWVSPKRHLQDWDAALDYVRVCILPS